MSFRRIVFLSAACLFTVATLLAFGNKPEPVHTASDAADMEQVTHEWHQGPPRHWRSFMLQH